MGYPDWLAALKYNPLQPLLLSGDESIKLFSEKDLLGKSNVDARQLWDLPQAQKIASRQQRNGVFIVVWLFL